MMNKTLLRFFLWTTGTMAAFCWQVIDLSVAQSIIFIHIQKTPDSFTHQCTAQTAEDIIMFQVVQLGTLHSIVS